MKPAAFFDLDNTLVKGSSLFLLAKGLIDSGLLNKSQLRPLAIQNLRYIYSKTERTLFMDKLIPKALHLLQGTDPAEFERVCEQIVEDFLPNKVYKSVVGFVNQHHQGGIDTWIVTASPLEIARIVAQKLQMTGALGTLCEIKNGVYSGKLASPVLHGATKAAAVKSLSTKENYELSSSYAYSDSLSDLPLLALVGTPVVINPNNHLFDLAAKNKWFVHFPSKNAA
jgi:HAD superfamily hydrolase (TIGR01490 family)